MTNYKFTIKITFRNGKELVLYSNDVSLRSGTGGDRFALWVDNEPVVRIFMGQPNVFVEGEYTIHNGAPIKSNLFKYFPEDWDQNDEQFNVIDAVYVNSKGVQVE